MLNAAILGAGIMGRAHFKAYQRMQDVCIKAIVDIDRDKALELIGDRDISIYHKLGEMIREQDIDFVDICAPTFLHHKQAMECFKNKLHVLCEKPIALSVLDAVQMTQTAKSAGVTFMVAQVLRFTPEYVYLKNTYDSGIYGRLLHLSMKRTAAKPDWAWKSWITQKDKSGRAPLDLHIHDADFIMWMLGTPDRVSAFVAEKDEYISHIVAHYSYSDVSASAQAGWYRAPIQFSAEYTAVFEKGVLELNSGKLVFYASECGVTHIDLSEIESDGYYSEIKYFTECLKESKEPETIKPHEPVECLRMIYKEIEAAHSATSVKV